METKRKKKLLNALMVVLILAIAVCGIMTVGSFRGWFRKSGDSSLSVERVDGVANIERKGIAYSLKKDQTLDAKDLIETKQGSSAAIFAGEQDKFTLNENTEMTVLDCDGKEIRLQIEQGEVFADMASQDKEVQVEFRSNTLHTGGAVFSLSVQSGSVSLNVYDGDIEVMLEDGQQQQVEAGEKLTVSVDAYDNSHISVENFQASGLNEFLILQAQKSSSINDLVFSAAELQSVLDEREAQKKAVLEAGINTVIPISENQEEGKETETKAEIPVGQETNVSREVEDGGTSSADSSYVREYIQEQGIDAGSSPAQEQSPQQLQEQPVQAQEPQPAVRRTCTIAIRCDTILNNMDDLSDGKEAYVPANGYILAASTVEFEEGETVFDILSRVCEYAGIQLEYSWTPVYNSYYIEGINHLYEFDCGNESGWMYQVNGWFPDYGCSSYIVQDGDSIVWSYTCNGLGADLGAK